MSIKFFLSSFMMTLLLLSCSHNSTEERKIASTDEKGTEVGNRGDDASDGSTAKKRYKATGSATTNVMGSDGCTKALEEARTNAINVCEYGKQTFCKVIRERKLESNRPSGSFSLTGYNLYTYTPGSCKYEVVAEEQD